MKVLELFCGTGSVSKICEKNGWECISVDLTDKLYSVDIKTDIMEWDYTTLPKDIDIIWASPPCNSFSSMLCIHKHIDIEKRMKEEGLPLLYKTLEIIDYFKPDYYFIENPKTGRMKNYMNELIPYHDVCYCRYGFDYKKPTRIWTNLKEFKPLYCNHKGKHEKSIGMTRKKKKGKWDNINGVLPTNKISNKYSIPPQLIIDIFDTIIKIEMEDNL